MVEIRGGGTSEHSVVKQWALSDPEGFRPLIDLLSPVVAQFLSRQIEAGAEAVQLFDTWAGILPDAFFERWCVKPAAAIIAVLKVKHPDVPAIAFPRGAGLAYDGFAEATGADCIGLDATVPLEWAAQKMQRRLGHCVQGNLDPQLLVAGGPVLYAETDRILRAPERRAVRVQPGSRHREDHAAGACHCTGQAGTLLDHARPPDRLE